MVRVLVVGAGGRMGSEVCRLCLGQPDLEVVGGIETTGHLSIGTPLGTGSIATDLGTAAGNADVIVDFSLPASTPANLAAAVEAKRPFVSGVTGLTDEHKELLRRHAASIPIVHAPNFSVGISVLCRLAAEAARLLGSEYDIEIVETHHRQKKDAPSGTALRLRDAVNHARDMTESSDTRDMTQFGPANWDRVPSPPGIVSLRIGDVVGDHTVIFGGPGERIELTHRATSRLAFASGVLAAIRFVHGRQPGLYSMDDVLAKSD